METNNATKWGRWAILGLTAQGWKQFYSARTRDQAARDMWQVTTEYKLSAVVVYGDENPLVRKGTIAVGTVAIEVR